MRFKRFNAVAYARKLGVPYFMADLLRQTSVQAFVEEMEGWTVEGAKRRILYCVSKQLDLMIVEDKSKKNGGQ